VRNFVRLALAQIDIPVIVLFKRLGLLDRLLSPAILLTMIIGVIIGEFAPGIRKAFDTARFDTVSIRLSSVFAML
jgi:ACR3 family arsenite efflux pump ArsB